MSEADFEIVRRVLEGWSDPDATGADPDLIAPDVVHETTGRWPGIRELYNGADELWEWRTQMQEVWERSEVEVQEFRAVGPLVVTRSQLRARGRDGIEAEMEVGHVWWLRGSLVHGIKSFESFAQALDYAEADPSRGRPLAEPRPNSLD